MNTFLMSTPLVIMTAGSWVLLAAGIVILVLLLFALRQIFSLRRVVAPNEVHIVRQGRKTLIYGNVDDTPNVVDVSAGNSYYEWPVWIPVLGVNVSVLPLSVFDIDLNNYNAYDKDRLPFVVDIQAFFRISNYKLAATRIKDFSELRSQLTGILEGASRSLLANEQLECIMGERAEYGSKFTNAVREQLANWGVQTVKNIELMDIRDARDETVIENIMKKKKSDIEKESRITVAKNSQAAEEAEILARQAVDLKKQDALETVGQREAEVKASVGIKNEKADQQIKDEAKVTKQKEMDITEVEKTRNAEIAKKAQVIEAEATKAKQSVESEGQLIASENEAKGIKVVGEAKANAEERMQMASVTAQTALAKEIGSNTGYQDYLVKTRQIEANERVGLKQAENLKEADIKIIAGAGNVTDGIKNASDALSPKGGYAAAGFLESFASTEEGKKVLEAIAALLKK